MEELKVKQFLLSMDDIQEIIDCASKGNKMEVSEMTDINTDEPYLEVKKNGEVWGTYLFGTELDLNE